jgi:hypothetical protein
MRRKLHLYEIMGLIRVWDCAADTRDIFDWSSENWHMLAGMTVHVSRRLMCNGRHGAVELVDSQLLTNILRAD